MIETRDFYTLTARDVGRATVRTAGGTVIHLGGDKGFMGKVQRQDIGKRVIRVALDVWQLEGADQRAARRMAQVANAMEWGDMDTDRALTIKPSESDRFPHHPHSMPTDPEERREWLIAYATGIINKAGEES